MHAFNEQALLREWAEQPFHLTRSYADARRWVIAEFRPVLRQRLAAIGFQQDKDTRIVCACLLASVDATMRDSADPTDQALLRSVDVFLSKTTRHPASIVDVACLLASFDSWKQSSRLDVLKWLKEQVVLCRAGGDGSDARFAEILDQIRAAGGGDSDVEDARRLYASRWA